MQTKILSFYVEPALSLPGFGARSDLLFIGAFHHTMYYNGDAVAHFVANVFPLIRRQQPGARIVVIGKEPPPELLALDDRAGGVHVLGSVDELGPYYDAARLFVAPHQYGAGIQIKVKAGGAATGTGWCTRKGGACRRPSWWQKRCVDSRFERGWLAHR